ncbi:hypothetical protein A2U01_0090452, partial [Trifolium medium]|nr:hypothetical protein [Trifolium medium]
AGFCDCGAMKVDYGPSPNWAKFGIDEEDLLGIGP